MHTTLTHEIAESDLLLLLAESRINNLFQQHYERTFDSCYVGCLPGYKDYGNLGIAATWSEVN